MEIVVKGRNVEVPEHFRIHVADKLAKVERYDQKLIRVDVELFHERNPRQSDHCQRVEITCASRGPVVRAEACASDFYAALDAAITRLDSRLRRAADLAVVVAMETGVVDALSAPCMLVFRMPAVVLVDDEVVDVVVVVVSSVGVSGTHRLSGVDTMEMPP